MNSLKQIILFLLLLFGCKSNNEIQIMETNEMVIKRLEWIESNIISSTRLKIHEQGIRPADLKVLQFYEKAISQVKSDSIDFAATMLEERSHFWEELKPEFDSLLIIFKDNDESALNRQMKQIRTLLCTIQLAIHARMETGFIDEGFGIDWNFEIKKDEILKKASVLLSPQIGNSRQVELNYDFIDLIKRGKKIPYQIEYWGNSIVIEFDHEPTDELLLAFSVSIKNEQMPNGSFKMGTYKVPIQF